MRDEEETQAVIQRESEERERAPEENRLRHEREEAEGRARDAASRGAAGSGNRPAAPAMPAVDPDGLAEAALQAVPRLLSEHSGVCLVDFRTVATEIARAHGFPRLSNRCSTLGSS